MKTYDFEERQFPAKGRKDTDVVLVVGFDFDVGISIVDARDHTHYIYCAYGPAGFRAKFNDEHPDLESYKDTFKSMAKMLRKGVFDQDKVNANMKKHGQEPDIIDILLDKPLKPSADNCPFNQ